MEEYKGIQEMANLFRTESNLRAHRIIIMRWADLDRFVKCLAATACAYILPREARR